MRKYKTLDGKNVYKIKRNGYEFFLANQNNYSEEIENLTNNLEDLKFNSIIIIFGLDTGEYIEEIKKQVCEQNLVIIYEPNKDIFEENNYINLFNNRIRLVLFEAFKVREQLSTIINPINFDNLYVHFFGNYEEVYKEECELLINTIDKLYMEALAFGTISNRFREIFLRNLIWNLDVIKSSTSIDEFKGRFKDVPAIIVSAGPSLKDNIEAMVLNKEILKKYLIIAGSRTLKALLKNGITPDIIVTIDPVDENYEMMIDYMDSKIPIAYYEYSNKKVLSQYKGEKIYLASILNKVVLEFNTLKPIYLGGSVAHTAVDVARSLGCSTIILAGQDLAFTNNNHHAEDATFNFDKNLDYNAHCSVIDVFGNEVLTSNSLNSFREKLEDYIRRDKEDNKVEYINVSKGARIEGAKFKELNEVFKMNICNKVKEEFKPNHNIKVNRENIITEISEFLKNNIEDAKYGIEKCTVLQNCDEEKSLVNISDEDEDYKEFIKCFSIIANFENSNKNIFIGGYFNKFIGNIKREEFRMLSKDYEKLTSNMKYQSKCLLRYFEEMKKMLEDAEIIVNEEVSNFNDYHKMKVNIEKGRIL